MEVTPTLYSGIGRRNYPQDACYLKFAHTLRLTSSAADGVEREVELQNLHFEDLGCSRGAGHRNKEYPNREK